MRRLTFGEEGSSLMTHIESSSESRRLTRSLTAARASYREEFSGFRAIALWGRGKEGGAVEVDDLVEKHKQTNKQTSERKFFAFKNSRCW